MILYEAAAAPAARAAESLVAGRRLTGRLLPYGASGETPFRFDPVERRFLFRDPGAAVSVGPWRVEAWNAVLTRFPAGPVLVGPGSAAEGFRGAYRAAAGAALAAGRPVYLLDPEAEGIPAEPGRSAVALCSWRPGGAASAFPGLVAAGEAGLRAAAVFPLLPGWTADTAELEALAAAAKAGGAAAFCPLAPALDGEGRRAIVEARTAADPASDGFFELVHHGDWSDRLGERLSAARDAGGRHGMASVPPRPVGKGERAGNAAASARLEELAVEREADEPRAALLYAAVRWIDDSLHDLAAVAREGNFRKIFPFDPPVADAAEAALREAR